MASINYERDHEAIYKAYPEVTFINEHGAFKDDGTEVTLEESNLDAARSTINADYAKVKYKDDRELAYPDWGVQLDYIYHNGIEKWKTDIVDPIKAKYPKPS